MAKGHVLFLQWQQQALRRLLWETIKLSSFAVKILLVSLARILKSLRLLLRSLLLLRLLPGNAFKKALAGFFCNEGAEGDLGYLGAFW